MRKHPEGGGPRLPPPALIDTIHGTRSARGGLAEKKDIVLNVILFLPFGTLLFLHRAKGIAASRSVLAPALFGMLFSVPSRCLYRCSFSAPCGFPTRRTATRSRLRNPIEHSGFHLNKHVPCRRGRMQGPNGPGLSRFNGSSQE